MLDHLDIDESTAEEYQDTPENDRAWDEYKTATKELTRAVSRLVNNFNDNVRELGEEVQKLERLVKDKK